MEKYDFGGYVTKSGVQCTDGVTIAHGAFKKNDGQRVSLVWNHQHSDPSDILGYVDLEHRSDGVYGKGTFNNSANALVARELLQHGDIDAMSICAQGLKRNGRTVLDGDIKEVSLVFAGANPGAKIEDVMLHSSDLSGDGTIILSDQPLDVMCGDADLDEGIKHSSDSANEKDETVEDVFNSLNDKQKKVVYMLIGEVIHNKSLEEDADDADPDNPKIDNKDGGLKHSAMPEDPTFGEVFDSLNEQQKNVVYGLIGEAIKTAGADADADESDNDIIKHSNKNKGGNSTMKKNVFEKKDDGTTLTHSVDLTPDDIADVFSPSSRTRYGTLKESVLQHGITNIEYLKPEGGALVNNGPVLITRDQTWVSNFMGKVRKSPFAKVRSLAATLTADEARARGYTKGKLKAEEVFSLLKRTTSPTTIYKKQKLDRDDVVDIIDFDVVGFMKSEMRLMLDEEAAVAALIGDGRLSSSDDKIDESCIRPIWTDADLYSIKKLIPIETADTADTKAKKFIREVVKARKDYKGSGNPICYTTEDVLTDCLLLEDSTGRVIYDTVDKLATALRVKEIVTVAPMENKTRTVDTVVHTLMAIIVNPDDYTVGADKGGSATMFDDFDIDYNKMIYLIETRFSGALTKPYSAIVIESAPAPVTP